MSIANKMSKSRDFFLGQVWPNIRDELGGGILRSVEETNPDPKFIQELDYFSGIDGWQIIKEKCAMRGVASRTQEGQNWRTFTVRYSRVSGAATEYIKRIKACVTETEQGFLYPYWTVQAYYYQGQCEVGIVDTKVFYRFLHSLNYNFSEVGISIRTAREDGTVFLVIPWDVCIKHIPTAFRHKKFTYHG